MSTDDLDRRIRALVREAVTDAPPAPDLPTAMRVVTPSPARRGMMWAGIGVAAAVIAVAVLVWTGRSEHPRIVGASTTSSADTVTPWPDSVAVIVASDRGVERVTSEHGNAVITRLVDGPVDRAFELDDGTLVYQRHDGDIVHRAADGTETALVTGPGVGLQDADLSHGQLRLVYRSATTDPGSSFQLNAWFQPNEPLPILPPGGFGVGYDRFSIVDDHFIVAATTDDTGQHSAVGFAVGETDAPTPTFDQPYQLAGDGQGTVGVLDGSGSFTTTGVGAGVIADLGDATDIADLDLRSHWVAVQRQDGRATLFDLRMAQEYSVPVRAAAVTVSRTAPKPTLPTAPGWPSDVALVVASDRGVERVVGHGGEPVVTRVLDIGATSKAFEVADGSFVVDSATISADAPDIARVGSDGSSATVTVTAVPSELQDVGPDGTILFIRRSGLRETFVMEYDAGAFRQIGDVRADATEISAGGDVVVGTESAPGGQVPFAMNAQGAPLDPLPAPLGAHPAVDATGTVYAWIDRSFLVVANTNPDAPSNIDYDVPSGIGDVLGIDLNRSYALVNGTNGSALVEFGRGTIWQLPVKGWATLSMAPLGLDAPPPSTPSTTVTSSAVSSSTTSFPGVVTAGADGVWEYTATGEVQWTSEPMAVAVKAPDGSMIMQRRSGNGEGADWTMADTLPLHQSAPGAALEDVFSILFPAADPVAGWYTLHDAASVHGRTYVLMALQFAVPTATGMTGQLVVIDVATPALITVGEESEIWVDLSRLHLSETGVFVGATRTLETSLFSLGVGNATPLEPTDLGLPDPPAQCSDCPRLYSISRDGARVAWLDGIDLVVRTLASGDEARTQLDERVAAWASDLVVGEGFVVIDRAGFGATPLPPIAVPTDGSGKAGNELHGHAATLSS
jgi:hypothetical protein